MRLYHILIALFLCISVNLNAQSQAKDSVAYYFEGIQKSFTSKEYDKAYNFCERVIAQNKENDSLNGLANLTLGKLLYLKRDYGNSVKHLNLAIEYFTKNNEYKLVNEAYLKLGTLYRLKRDFKTSKSYFLKAITSIKKHYSNKYENLIEAYNGMLRAEKAEGNFSEALEHLGKGLELARTLKNEKQEAVFLTYKGDVLQQQRKFDSAIENYLKAIEIKEKLYGVYNRENLITYNNLAGAYGQLHYFDKAIKYQERVIAINQKLPENKRVASTTIYANLAVYYSEFGQPKKSIKYHEKGLNFLEKELGNEHYLFPMLHKNFGDTYYSLKDYTNAQNYYQASLNYNLKKFGASDISLTEGYTNLALVAKQKGEFNVAEKYLKKSLNIYPKDYFQVIPCQLEMANVLIAQKNYKAANSYIDSVAKKLPKKNFSELNFDQLKDRREFYNAKINYFTNNKLQETDSLGYFYKKAIALDDFIIKDYTTTSTKDFQLKKAFPVYESYLKYIVNAKNENEKNSAFEILEKTKARRLTESFNKEKSDIKVKVPDSLSKLEQQLGVDILYYEEQKSLETNDPQPKSDSLISAYSTKLFNLKRQQNQLQETFKNDYPDYYNLIYNRNVIPVEKLQKHLSEKQSLVEYFVGEDDIFIFVISKNTLNFTSVPKDFPLKKWITQLREGIYNYWALPNATDENLQKYNSQYKDMAFKLYQKLILPIENEITENVIIIPDGELNFIPFDALLTKDSSKLNTIKALPYLLKKFQISYNYSATLFGQLKEKNASVASNEVLAFAPQFKGEKLENIATRRSGLGELKYNVKEVEAIDNLFDTNIFKGNQATRNKFVSNANDYKIIHLSTHAKSNDVQGEDSFIAFSKSQDSLEKNQLYVKELYNLDLDADMVVLSACETGIGELQKGEGVISLARAFTYAGARSTVTSLWNVNDAQTTKLMALFYTNLKQGMDKGTALHKAKLTYIQTEDLAAPYFWAAFIPAGNMYAIDFNIRSQNYYLVTVSLVFLLLLAYWWLFKK